MLKKLSFSVSIVLFLAAALVVPAYAQEDDPPGRPGADPERPLDGPRGRGRRGEDRPDAGRYGGQVTGVGSSSFSIENQAGTSFTFAVDENTRFHSRDGEVTGLGDLETGMYVHVLAVEQDDGSLLALAVGVADPDRIDGRYALGEVTAVGNSSFTILTRDGNSLTFQVTNETRFHSRNGEVNGLDDLETGMIVAVKYEEQDGGLVALAVGAGALHDRPRGQRAAGQVIDVGESSFTINQTGEHLTFQVTDSTRFHSRDGEVTGLEDLANGMQVVVFYQTADDGSLVALLVHVGQPGGGPPGGPPGGGPPDF